MSIKNFIKECQNKDVHKLVSIYLVSTWVLLQVMAVIWEPIGLPKKSVTVLILILVIAFPFYLYFIYKFQVFKTVGQEQTNEEAVTIASFKKLYLSAVSMFAVICAFVTIVIVNANFFNESDISLSSTLTAAAAPEEYAKDNIAVLKFSNNTADERLDIVGKMAADWIFHGINEKKAGKVISAESILQYSKDFGVGQGENELEILNNYMKPGKIIMGTYFEDENQLVLQSSIIDGKTSEVLISFTPQYCDLENPLVCIDNLKQLIMSFIFLEEEDKELNLQQFSPPKFSAYEALLEAKTRADDPEDYLDLLNKSIASDSTFFEPQVLRVAHYYSIGDYKKADSLRKTIKVTSFSNKRQRNLLELYEALMAGKNDRVYETLLKEYQFCQQELVDNSSTMTVAQLFVNKPEDVGPIFQVISMEGVDVKDCSICITRYYVNALSSIELGYYKKVIDSLKPLINKVGGATSLTEPLIAAYVRSGKSKEITRLLNDRNLLRDPEKLAAIHLYTGKEGLLKGDIAFAKANFSKTRELLEGDESTDGIEALYYLEEYDKVLPKLKLFLAKNPKNQVLQSYQAISLAKTGDLKGAQKSLEAIKAIRDEYDFGATDYQLAKYYASIGNDKQALELLENSIAAGNRYTSTTFQNDPHFKSLIITPKFKKIMTYWH